MNCLYMLFQHLSHEVLTPFYITFDFQRFEGLFPVPRVFAHNICADLETQKADFHC